MELEGESAEKHCSDRRGSCAISSPFINGWLISDVLMVCGDLVTRGFPSGKF